ncbi:unnamed protein product [Trichogramma brassicae]|uniref:Uncharacterized protein n=1 Tax=Trichogramma brassicae TaxID=86971 RepID=A0A6H5IWM8_9HYME|nr:unnamed protein product [Trichogramma brassicae]
MEITVVLLFKKIVRCSSKYNLATVGDVEHKINNKYETFYISTTERTIDLKLARTEYTVHLGVGSNCSPRDCKQKNCQRASRLACSSSGGGAVRRVAATANAILITSDQASVLNRDVVVVFVVAGLAVRGVAQPLVPASNSPSPRMLSLRFTCPRRCCSCSCGHALLSCTLGQTRIHINARTLVYTITRVNEQLLARQLRAESPSRSTDSLFTLETALNYE